MVPITSGLKRTGDSEVTMADELRRRPPRTRLTREEKKQQTRERLLESAHALIALKGYEGAAVDDIAEDAGYSRGAFYSNFANKQAMMTELIQSCFDSDLEALGHMGTLTDVSELEQGFREYARLRSSDPENTLWTLEFELAAVRHPELRDAYAEQFEKLRREVRSMLHNAFAAMEHPDPKATERFADVFIVILSGLSLMQLLYPESFDEGLFGDAFAALVRGIHAEAGRQD
jgi:AcrR family transcriptional regulator